MKQLIILISLAIITGRCNNSARQKKARNDETLEGYQTITR
jgi:hypothetical protein